MTTKKEAVQKVLELAKTLEAEIRATKKVLRQPHTDLAEVGEAQRTLRALKKEATLCYAAVAASRGREHSKSATELLNALVGRSNVPMRQLTVYELVAKLAPVPVESTQTV